MFFLYKLGPACLNHTVIISGTPSRIYTAAKTARIAARRNKSVRHVSNNHRDKHHFACVYHDVNHDVNDYVTHSYMTMEAQSSFHL